MPNLQALDDGSGNIKFNGTTIGTVNYTDGTIVIDPTPAVTGKFFDGNIWVEQVAALHFHSGILDFSYSEAGVTSTAKTQTFALPAVQFKFGGDLITDSLVPQSLRFRWGSSNEYRDVLGNGTIYRHSVPWTAGDAGTYAGTVNYQTRTVSLINYVTAAVNAVTVLSCLTQYGRWPSNYAYGRTPGNPVSTGTFYVRCTTIDGREITGQSDASGIINAAEIQGTINQEMGVFNLSFGSKVLDSSLTSAQKLEPWYDAGNVDGTGHIWKPTYVVTDSLRMNCVITSTIPLSPDELGLDPVRLPSTGKVPIFKTGYRLVVHDTQYVTLDNPSVAGSTIDCGRVKISRVRLEDALGRRVPDSCLYPGQYVQYSSLSDQQKATYNYWDIRNDGTVWLKSSMDLDAGLVELASPLVLTGFAQPLKLYHTTEDAVLATSTDLSGYITVNSPLKHSYTAANSLVSSQLFYGDMWARYINLFSQVTWTGTWSESQIGSATAGQYNDVLYPVIVTNDGVIQERWRITFTSTTAFAVYGERSGQIAIGDINTDCAPANPVTNNPYFSLDHRGWGIGWVAGNTVRFDTLWPGAFWIARCISPGVATGTADTIGLAFRGDSEPA